MNFCGLLKFEYSFTMFSKVLKIALVVVLLGLGVYSFIDEEIGNCIFLTLMVAFPIILLFRHEYIIMALWHLRKQNFEKAQSFLNRIKEPNHLIKTQDFRFLHNGSAKRSN